MHLQIVMVGSELCLPCSHCIYVAHPVSWSCVCLLLRPILPYQYEHWHSLHHAFWPQVLLACAHHCQDHIFFPKHNPLHPEYDATTYPGHLCAFRILLYMSAERSSHRAFLESSWYLGFHSSIGHLRTSTSYTRPFGVAGPLTGQHYRPQCACSLCFIGILTQP